MKKWTTQKMIYTGMLAAVAGVLMSLEISVPMMPPFYKVDFSDVPSFVALFTMGLPLVGVSDNFVNGVTGALFLVVVYVSYRRNKKGLLVR